LTVVKFNKRHKYPILIGVDLAYYLHNERSLARLVQFLFPLVSITARSSAPSDALRVSCNAPGKKTFADRSDQGQQRKKNDTAQKLSLHRAEFLT
jgi:hypothetical protein